MMLVHPKGVLAFTGKLLDMSEALYKKQVTFEDKWLWRQDRISAAFSNSAVKENHQEILIVHGCYHSNYRFSDCIS